MVWLSLCAIASSINVHTVCKCTHANDSKGNTMLTESNNEKRILNTNTNDCGYMSPARPTLITDYGNSLNSIWFACVYVLFRGDMHINYPRESSNHYGASILFDQMHLILSSACVVRLSTMLALFVRFGINIYRENL